MRGILIIGGVLAGALIVDRLLLAAERRGWVYWRRRDTSAVSAAIMDFDTFLNPGRQHLIDEKRRQELVRDEVTPADPRFTQIDLDSGTATVRLPRPDDDEPR